MSKRSKIKIITREVRIIRAIREKKKLTVQKAAELIGTNKPTLTSLENGRIDLTAVWITKILKGYGATELGFKQMIEAKDMIKEEVVLEIDEMLLKLSYDRLLAIRQMLVSFSSS